MDKIVDVENVSFFSRIKNSFVGLLVGLILFIGSFILLWWNEGNSVNLIKKANYIEKEAISVNSNSIDRANDNKIIYTSGLLTTNETLQDENVTMQQALVLNRKVEMYQWREDEETEEKDNLGGSSTKKTTYTYSKTWSERPIDSSRFHQEISHQNPSFPISSQRYEAVSGHFGAYTLTGLQTQHINKLITIDHLPSSSKYTIFEGKYYSGNTPDNPEIGDIRISYSYAPSNITISVIGQQTSDNVITSANTNFGSIYLQSDGDKSKDAMIQDYRNLNSILTWVLRFVGWLIMFIGLLLIIKPITIIAKIIPAISYIIEWLSGFILFIISLILSLSTIAIAWLAYRPFFAISIILIISGFIYLLVKYIKNKKEQI